MFNIATIKFEITSAAHTIFLLNGIVLKNKTGHRDGINIKQWEISERLGFPDPNSLFRYSPYLSNNFNKYTCYNFKHII